MYGDVPPEALICTEPNPFIQVPVTNNSYPKVLPLPKGVGVGVGVGGRHGYDVIQSAQSVYPKL